MARVKLSSWLISAALPAGLVAGTTVAGTLAKTHHPRERTAAVAARLPLAFEANEGQTDDRASFLARGNGYTVFVSPSEAVLKLHKAAPRRSGPFVKPGRDQQVAHAPASVLRLGFVNARKDAPVTGEEALPGKVQYFRGGDKTRHASAFTYRKARCSEVYPGIDVVYYGNQRQLEYDFVVAPGADPDQIRMRLDGAQDVSVTQNGDLDIQLAEGGISLQKPHVYQDVDGVKQVVASNYRLGADGEVAFELGAYDAARPLVIDPVIVYSTLLGGSGFDSGAAVALGADGSTFVAGYTESADFPVSGGTSIGSGDAFVTKYSPDGSEIVFSAYLGGTGSDFARGIGVDPAGRVIISGTTDSTDFPVAGGFQTQLGGKTDAFVVRLSSTGETLEYGTFLGGAESDGSTRMTLDPDGNVYLTGYTGSTNFPHTANAMQTTFSGDYDAFATKVNADGSLAFSTYLGGRDGDSGYGIALAPDGSIYIGGSTDSGDFATGPVSVIDTFMGGRFGDAFVTKLAADGSERLYSTYIGGSGSDQGADIAVDRDGFCYLTGTTDSNDLMLASPVIQPFQQTPPGGISDIFVHKIVPSGGGLVYTTYLGSPGEDVARAIEVDEDFNPHTKAYILGETPSASFPLLDPFQSIHGGNSDLFLTKLHENVYLQTPKIVLDYSTFLGGSDRDRAGDLAVDAIGNAAITGDTSSGDFPQHQGPNPTSKSKKRHISVQGFVTKVFDGIPEPGGVLQVVPKIAFGTQRLGKTKSKKVILRNTSRTTRLAVTVETPAAPILIGKGVQSVFIKPGGQFTVDLTFAPSQSGELSRALVVRSSDPARPVVNIPMTAKAK